MDSNSTESAQSISVMWILCALVIVSFYLSVKAAIFFENMAWIDLGNAVTIYCTFLILLGLWSRLGLITPELYLKLVRKAFFFTY